MAPEQLVQVLFGIVLGIVGWNVRSVLIKVDALTRLSNGNRERLIRIETSMNLREPPDYERDYDAA